MVIEAILPVPEDSVRDIRSAAEIAHLQDGEVGMMVTLRAMVPVAK